MGNLPPLRATGWEATLPTPPPRLTLTPRSPHNWPPGPSPLLRPLTSTPQQPSGLSSQLPSSPPSTSPSPSSSKSSCTGTSPSSAQLQPTPPMSNPCTRPAPTLTPVSPTTPPSLLPQPSSKPPQLSPTVLMPALTLTVSQLFTTDSAQLTLASTSHTLVCPLSLTELLPSRPSPRRLK